MTIANIVSYIHRADINLLTKPNRMICLCCIENIDMNLSGVGGTFLVSEKLTCEIQYTK